MSNVSASVMSAAVINFHNKKVRYKMDYYILCTFLLMIILLSIIAIICYPYAKHRSKEKKYWRTSKIKMEQKNYNVEIS